MCWSASVDDLSDWRYETAGFKYFDCHNITAMSIQTRGYCDGVFEIRTSWEGEILGEIRVAYTNFWETFSTQVRIPDGVHAIYLTYRGGGNASLRSFNLQSD